MSFDAYHKHTGGSITIAVTATDNPIPSQSGRSTPEKATPAVPDEQPKKPAQGKARKGKKKKS